MPPKLTQEKYINKLKVANPDIIVLGKYDGDTAKILHKCLICGYEWCTTPHTLLYKKSGCPKCGYRKNGEKRRFTTEEYIEKVKAVTNNIEVIGEYINSATPITHKCKICGHGENNEWLTTPLHVLDGHGCPVCSGNIIGSSPKYINSIWTSEYKDYFSQYLTEEQMKSNMPNTHAKIDAVCPLCKRHKMISPNSLLKEGLGCICSDCISYPNKFMFAFLEQIKIDFYSEKSFSWSNGKIYDFYIPSINCIVERHGGQHYTGWNHDDDSLKTQQLNDEYKKQLAIKNGINNYIVIDCRKSNAQFITTNIVKSKLLDMFNSNITNINIDKCNEFAIDNAIKLVCNMWNDGASIKNIKEKFKIAGPTIRRYLIAGSEVGWCNNYTVEESRKRSSVAGIPNLKNATSIYCKELNKVFESQKEAAKHVDVTYITIGSCCREELKTAGGYHWYYLYDRKLRNGNIVNGAITLGLITENAALNQLNSSKNSLENVIQLAC